MRYFRIFLLHFENVFQCRSAIFVWFLISLFHPIIYLLFWRGSTTTFSDVTYYYLFFLVAGGLLFVHVETDAYEDIQQGQLSAYLLKPLSYLTAKFFSELPWRLIQGGFGILTLLFIVIMTPSLPHLSFQINQVGTAVIITVFGYMIMFLFKMIILLLALWFTDIGGLQQLSEVLIITFAGFIMPIRFFPEWIAHIIYFTPFPYSVYFPVVAFQGLIPAGQVISIFGIQLFWIVTLFLIYQRLWTKGIMKYSGVGQ